jgi:signal transduction histidine kinase/CheY-like chemotaxis protein
MLSIAITKRNLPRSLSFVFLSLCVSLYSYGYLIEITSTNLRMALVGGRLQYMILPILAAFYFLFTLEYYGNTLRKKGHIVLILIYPIINAILMMGNNVFFPYYTYFAKVDYIYIPFPHLLYRPGMLYYINSVFVYACLIAAIIVILRYFISGNAELRKQSIVVIAASLLPVSFFNLARFEILPHGFDLSPAALAFSELALGLHILRFRMADWMHLARDIVLENINDAFILLDNDNNFLDANAMALKYFPKMKDLSMGKHISMIEKFPYEITGNADSTSEFSLRTDEGTRHLRASQSPVRFNGKVVCICIMIYDVTEIHKLIAEIELIMQSARGGFLNDRVDSHYFASEYRPIILGVNATLDVVCTHFDSMPDAIVLLGADGKTRYQNKSAEALCSLHAITNNDTFLHQILLQNDSDIFRPDELLARMEKDSYFTDITLTNEMYETRNYSLALTPVLPGSASGIRDNGGASAGSGGGASADGSIRSADNTCYMLMLSDITILTGARTEAELASRAKGDFLSRMSHEIRTPMNAIVGMAQIAKNSPDITKINDCLSKIQDNSNHLLGIINDILDFSKLEAGKLSLDEEMFSLTESIDFVVSMFELKAKEKNIDLMLNIAHLEHDELYTDALRLNQTLINLLSNAVKFTNSGGKIDLTVNEESHDGGFGVYRFTIRDTGIGIEPKQAAKLFSPFEQANAGVSTRFGGTGLGLAICKNLVEMMGGGITFYSEPGKGSTFSFTINVRFVSDAAKSHPEKDTEVSDVPRDFSGRRVLIVDDIEINREILLEVLRETGIATDCAEDGLEALNKFRVSTDGYYDIILMDIQMPVLDGCAATREIRACSRNDAESIKIIAMTANVLAEDVNRALDSGMDGHLAKPVDFTVLINTIEAALSETRS